LATLGHYIHILTWHGLQLTLLDAVLILNMRAVIVNLKDKVLSYKNYRKLAQNMRERYPDATSEELTSLNDDCAICRDRMEAAKKLPCGHIFHHSCLRSWLEHHYNCPTCRYSLIDTANGAEGHPIPPQPRPQEHQHFPAEVGAHQPQNIQEIFRFNGGRWFSWLPTVQLVSERRFVNRATVMVSQDMVQRVLEVFPNIPQHVILEDLNRTHSVDITLENILEGRIEVVQQQQSHQLDHNSPQSPLPQSPLPQSISQPTPQSFPQSTSQPSLQSPQSTSQFTNSPSHSKSSPALEPITNPSAFKFADDFASSPKERHSLLQKRKQLMIEQARRQYLSKQSESQMITTTTTTEEKSTSPSTTDTNTDITEPLDTPETRRRLALEAAEKRKQENKKNV